MGHFPAVNGAQQDGIDDMVAAWDPEHGARMIARLMGEG